MQREYNKREYDKIRKGNTVNTWTVLNFDI